MAAIKVPIVSSFNGAGVNSFSKAFKQIRTDVANTSGAMGKMKAASVGAMSAIKANAVLLGAAVGGMALVLGKKAVDAASNLEESMNAVDVTFKDSADSIHDLGAEAVDSFGLSERAFNEAAVSFAAFAETIAGEGGDVSETIDDLIGRATDFASVYNIELDEAMRVFQSTLAGQTEPLRKYGKDVSAAAVTQHALATGLVDSKSEMTEAIKVTARYELLMASTADTAGDFANTQDGLANSTKTLNAKMEELQAELGERLIPIVASAVGELITLVEVVDQVANVANEGGTATDVLFKSVEAGINPVGALVDALGESKDAIFGTTEASEDLREATTVTSRVTLAAADAAANFTRVTEAEEAAIEEAAEALEEKTAALDENRRAVDDVANAVIAATNSDLGYRNTVKSTAEEIMAATIVLNDNEASLGDQEQAVYDAESAILSQASAAVKLAEDTAEASGAALTAEQSAKVYKEELERLGADLNGPLALYVQRHIDRLNAIPRSISTQLAINTYGTIPTGGSNGVSHVGSRFAAGETKQVVPGQIFTPDRPGRMSSVEDSRRELEGGGSGPSRQFNFSFEGANFYGSPPDEWVAAVMAEGGRISGELL